MRIITIALAGCLILGLSSTAQSQTRPGNPIHDFTLQDLNGNSHRPNQYSGQVLLLFLLGHN